VKTKSIKNIRVFIDQLEHAVRLSPELKLVPAFCSGVVQIKSRACSLHIHIHCAAPLEVYKLVSQDIGALATQL
jgi:hypothetical protein